MLQALFGKFNELAIILGVLSQVLAATQTPAVYEIPAPTSSEPVFVSVASSSQNTYNSPLVPFIANLALERGIDPELAIFIAYKESRFNPLARNPSSTAKGLFQWLDSSWKDFCEGDVYNPYDNASCAILTLSRPYGIRHWSADLTMRRWLIEAGFVKCFPGKNNCDIIAK